MSRQVPVQTLGTSVQVRHGLWPRVTGKLYTDQFLENADNTE